jgi:hypothetical protein
MNEMDELERRRVYGESGWSPPGMGDARVPPWLRRLVRLLDGAFVVPGTEFRVGLDPLLGFLLPGLGDVVGGLASNQLVVVAFRNGVHALIVHPMLLNVRVDALVGAVPFLGDLFDAAFRANEKNLDLLDRYAEPGRKPSAGDYLVVTLVLGMVLALALLPILVVALLLKLLLGDG